MHRPHPRRWRTVALGLQRITPRSASLTLLHGVVLLLLAGGLGALVLPFVHPGLPFGHDLSAHLTYSYLFDRALRGGQFPVRWTHGVAAGHGQPLFNFYQPGFYYAV